MNHIQRKNAQTFARCQARHDAMEHPDYYKEDAPPCHVCGYDSDQDSDDGPICEECLHLIEGES